MVAAVCLAAATRASLSVAPWVTSTGRFNAFKVSSNPSNPAVAEAATNQMHAAARTLGLELHVLHASAEPDFEVAFAKVRQLGAVGLVMSGGEPLFASRSVACRVKAWRARPR
jgi:hypothetical protein